MAEDLGLHPPSAPISILATPRRNPTVANNCEKLLYFQRNTPVPRPNQRLPQRRWEISGNLLLK